MIDRELLKLAAKSAGIEIDHWRGTSAMIVESFDEAEYERWNPLTDDGDALRLAVKLKIDVAPVYIWEGPFGNGSNGTLQDPYAATRCAIVRAAASIGRAMK